MGFEKVEIRKVKAENPELLFLDLRGRDPEIKHLWAHQADLLRKYTEEHKNTQDISFELPTGTGKTLVGLLIGEWRRQYYNERILYLCPTRQLAYQVEKLSKKYGIKACAFIAPQRDYPQDKYSNYSSSELIAISTYSGVFNTNPRLKDANVIICDDAHAADNYISSLWSLNINRFDHRNLYDKIISLFEDNLSYQFVHCVKNDNTEFYLKDQIEMIPIPILWKKHQKLIEIIHVELNEEENQGLTYSWSMIHNNIISCNVFISWWENLIRPWVPPSLTHKPFQNAKQRIYMSATLGEGGELERITGVPKIERLPIPPGWEKKGSGRRFIIFPDFNFESSEYSDWLINKISEMDRTLILCPNYHQFFSIEHKITESSKTLKILRSNDIEDSLKPFTNEDNATLILINRYDGLDLPGDNCRQLIVYGLPAAVNLQEKFLLFRLNIYSVLKDRIVTRLTQACGRCNRGPNDYSLILLTGEDIRDFCLRREIHLSFHPELQAEIEFGIKQSNVSNLEDLDERIRLFYAQGDEWQKADENIKALRENVNIIKDPYTKTLNSIVSKEINYQYALWKKDYATALEISRKIGDNLAGDEFEGYRALWNYFTGSIASILYDQKNQPEYLKIAKDFYRRAKNCSRYITWFSELLNLEEDIDASADFDEFIPYAVEKIQKTLSDLGGVGGRFEIGLKRIENFINSDNTKQFEVGITKLGKLLGFKTKRPLSEAAPDSIWSLSNKLLILFEAKSGESKEGGISKDNCLQAKGHYDWAQANCPGFEQYEEILSVIVGHRKKIQKSALSFAENLFVLNINRVKEIFREISGILRRVRDHSINYEEEKTRKKIYEELNSRNLDPANIIQELRKKPLISLEQI